MSNVYAYCYSVIDMSVTPVEGVLVSVVDTGTRDVLSFAYTAATGIAALGEFDSGTYEIHVNSLVPVNNGRLQLIEVPEDEEVCFDFVLFASNTSAPPHSEFCRCSGYFVDAHGNPVAGATISFSEISLPTTLSASSLGVLPVFTSVKTDASGYASVDLLRENDYRALVSGYESADLLVSVPDLSAASLPDILFPVVVAVVLRRDSTPVETVSLSIGEEVELTIETVYSSGLVKEGRDNVTLSFDTEACTARFAGTSVFLTGVSAGTAILSPTATYSDGEPRAYPQVDVGGSISVTVS